MHVYFFTRALPSPFSAARYHRFVIDNEKFPSDALEITAWTDDGLVMAARHKVYTHLQVSFFFAPHESCRILSSYRSMSIYVFTVYFSIVSLALMLYDR